MSSNEVNGTHGANGYISSEPSQPGPVGRVHVNGATSDEDEVRRIIVSSGKFRTQQEVAEAMNSWKSGKPLAYITEQHTFGTLGLIIRPPIYIPRVETEQWVLLLASHISETSGTSGTRSLRILDICTGSGCIPLLFAHLGKGKIHTVGLEVDDNALSVARMNASRNGLEAISTFRKFDLFEDDPHSLLDQGGFDIIISNPPYVSSEDMKKIAGGWWEGRYALQGKLKGHKGVNGAINDSTLPPEEGGDDGLSAFRRIHEIYRSLLSSTRDPRLPKVVLEIGAKQAGAVKEMFASEGRMVVTKETPRRKSFGAPQLETGSMVGTERSVWIYDQ